jgi:hypothetical protein
LTARPSTEIGKFQAENVSYSQHSQREQMQSVVSFCKILYIGGAQPFFSPAQLCSAQTSYVISGLAAKNCTIEMGEANLLSSDSIDFV